MLVLLTDLDGALGVEGEGGVVAWRPLVFDIFLVGVLSEATS